MPLQTYFSFQRYRERGTALRRSSLSLRFRKHTMPAETVYAVQEAMTHRHCHTQNTPKYYKRLGEKRKTDKEEGGGGLQAAQATNTRNIPPNSMPTLAHWQQSTQCSRTRRLVCVCQRYTLKVSAVRFMIQGSV